MSQSSISDVIWTQQSNTIAAWLITGVMLLVGIVTLLEGELLWGMFACATVGLAVLPVLWFRTPQAMLPWEVLLLTALPVVGRSVAQVPQLGLVGEYLAVAAVALVVAVELDIFTTVRMTYGFAVLFVVIATMGGAAVWAVVRWTSHLYLGTAFVLEERALMLEFVASTAAGALAGVVFELYFRRRARVVQRLPDGVGEAT